MDLGLHGGHRDTGSPQAGPDPQLQGQCKQATHRIMELDTSKWLLFFSSNTVV